MSPAATEISLSSILRRMANPVRVFRALRTPDPDAPSESPHREPELRLYSRVLESGHLHYGYFPEAAGPGERISLADLREAQRAYAELLVEQVPECQRPVLDCGCGTGGTMGMLIDRGHEVVGITPEPSQAEYVRRHQQRATVLRTRFEDLDTERFAEAFGAILCGESLQYLDLDRAFEVAGAVLPAGGRWVVCDYFRIREDAHEGSGHPLTEFRGRLERHGWSIREHRDITDNVVGTLAFAHSLAKNLAVPILDFLVEKFRRKRPGLHELCREELESLETSLQDKMRIVDPRQFRRDKTYRLFVLEKR